MGSYRSKAQRALDAMFVEWLRTRPFLMDADAPATWIDADGYEWRTPRHAERLKRGRAADSALKDYVRTRDGNVCCYCGSDRWPHVDHVVSRRNGGAHHPSNLQLLCESHNAMKAGLWDARPGGRV